MPANPAIDLDPASLAASARERSAPYKIPARFVAVKELPRNEAGKGQYCELLALVPAE